MFVTISNQSVPGFNYFDEVFRYINEDLNRLILTANAAEHIPVYHGAQQLRGIFFKMRSEYGIFRHYYRDYAVPAAEAMAERLQAEYEVVKGQYPDFVQNSGYFDVGLRDVIHAGYVGINHKLESFVAFLRAHAKGKEYGPLGANPIKGLLYENMLRDRYGILLEDFIEKEPASPILCDECSQALPQKGAPSNRVVLYPRIQRIRMIANRVKHQSGYPKSQSDPLIEALFEQLLGKPIKIPVEEFLYDLAYADAYLFLLCHLVDHAYHLAITEKVMENPPDAGQEENRAKIEQLSYAYAGQLEADVAQYKNKHIDTLKIVL